MQLPHNSLPPPAVTATAVNGIPVTPLPVTIPGLGKMTRRGFDTMALTTVETMTGADILALREREGISQAVLALHLNVRTKLVSDWERGVKHPSGPSLKLLALIRAKGIGAIA